MDLKHIKRMSIMMRSYFGAQEGDFSLSIRSISAISRLPEHDDGDDKAHEKLDSSWIDIRELEEGGTHAVDPTCHVVNFDNWLVKVSTSQSSLLKRPPNTDADATAG